MNNAAGSLNALYQDVLLDHGKNPRGYGLKPACAVTVSGANPLCGDAIAIHVSRKGDAIEAVGFTGESCLICNAAASMLCVSAEENRSINALTKRAQHVLMHLNSGDDSADERLNDDSLQALTLVRRHPMRVDCAALPWRTLLALV